MSEPPFKRRRIPQRAHEPEASSSANSANATNESRERARESATNRSGTAQSPVVRPRAFERPFESETATFGLWLRRQREAREVSLREIADKTKISFRYLEAMEDDRFDLLPAPVFARGFLREYARYVGLNPDEVLNSFLAAQQRAAGLEGSATAGGSSAGNGGKSTSLGPNPENLSSADRSLSPAALAIGAIAAVVAIALLVAWLLWRHPGDAGDGTGATGEPSSTSDSASPAAASSAFPQTPTPSADSAASNATPQTLPANPAPPAAALRLALDFTGDCWVEARVDGKSRVSEKRVQGESLEIEAEREIQLTLGDAGVVEAHLNGQPYALPRERGSVVRRTIDLAAAAPPSRPNEAR